MCHAACGSPFGRASFLASCSSSAGPRISPGVSGCVSGHGALAPKVESLLTDLARQGIPLDRYYFDGDIRRVTHRPHRAPLPFDVVMRRRPDAPVSSSARPPPLPGARSGGRSLAGRSAQPLAAKLAFAARRVRLWSAELGTLPINVWPMTRLGLAQVAKDLAALEGATGRSQETDRV